MTVRILSYVIVMAAVTYVTRAVPFLLIRKKPKSRFLQSFQHYVPFAMLAAMTFPHALYATPDIVQSASACAVALALAFLGGSLPVVSLAGCATVILLEFLPV